MSFKRLDPEDFLVSSDSIVNTLWSTNTPNLTTFFTSSIQIASSAGNYYYSVYQTGSTLSNAAVQFDIAYADSLGSGSVLYNNAVPELSPTKTIYGQYRSMILEDENSSFIFGKGTNIYTTDNFWAINFERARYKQSLFPGSLNLNLSGSGGIINLTDDSLDNPVSQFLGSTRVYQLISGSNGTAGTSATSGYVAGSGSYGLVFPDLGTILLNPYALSQSIEISPSRSNNSDGSNNLALFNAIKLGASFTINSQETLTSDYVFVRARNSEFNYSENPSFISGSTGEVIYDQFINAPQVYLTTIGMYNDSNELIAVAKMSRPLLKDFTKEALVRVKLDF
jgi:hypothetical protein